jgi:hypothetical protein
MEPPSTRAIKADHEACKRIQFGCAWNVKSFVVNTQRNSNQITGTCISNIDNTSHEEETSNNRRKTKIFHCPQLDHHDADGLPGHKTWRTTQTTTRTYICSLLSIF